MGTLYRNYGKRALDVVISLGLLPCFLAVFVLVAPWILADDFGPVFYCGYRLGKDGRKFRMYKFRSMKEHAPDIRNSDGTTFNAESDERVTRAGRFLRKTSLDEVPQILNVLKGDMSWVGPRPDLPDAVKLYTKKTREKLKVRPGVTGYSQAYYRNASTLEQRFAKDVYYARHVSLGLDLRILWRTVQTVVTQKNVYRNKGEEHETGKG